MQQRTPEWYSWRSRGIGSSDASSIMGCNPWKDIKELWLEKTGQKSGDIPVNAHMQRGIDFEPAARDLAAYLLGRQFIPRELVHPDYSHIRASLDGLDPSGQTVLEIKCPTAKNFYQLMASGEIPDRYYCQMQHQMLVVPESTEAVFFNYLETDKGNDYLILKVPRDEAYLKELEEREHVFWDCVQRMIEPELPVREGVYGS